MANSISKNKITKVQNVIADYLFRSDFYEIKNWSFNFKDDTNTSKGYNDCLCVVIVKRGNFLFDLSKESYDIHTGHIIIDKPDYEYSLRPATGECSIFNFTDDFYKQFIDDFNLKHSFFFSNPNILSLLLKTTPETEYLHFQIFKNAKATGKLEMDNMVLELLKHIVASITNSQLEDEPNEAMKRFHLSTVERAKEYIHENFSADISLYEIASYSLVSPFHFSRIFKKFTSFSPHQYLHNVRLKHSEMLLKNSTLPVAEISIAAGFNSADYFATAFKQKYKTNPTKYRTE